MKNLKIVLTGGPCGGKTTSIQKIEEEFTEKGYQVLIVPEAATLLINSGIKPFGNNCLSMYEFQKYVMSTQMYLESLATKCAEETETPTLIICDRGLLDDKAYVSESEFEQLLKEFNQKEFKLMSRYDLVIHLKTAADGKEEFYTLANNNSRTETPEEARQKDQKTLNSWLGHEKLVIIGNDTDFQNKIAKVIQTIHALTDKEYPIQKQEKYLVEVDKEALMSLNPVIHHIEQYVIADSDSEYIYRKTTKKNDTKYTLITKKDTSLNDERIVTRRNISEKEYLSRVPQNQKPIRKTRYCFPYENQYFRLDIFEDGLEVLEIEETNKTKKRTIPKCITLFENISEDPSYRNRALYEKYNAKATEYVKK